MDQNPSKKMKFSGKLIDFDLFDRLIEILINKTGMDRFQDCCKA